MNRFADESGHCYVELSELCKKCVEILGIEDAKIIMTLDELMGKRELFKEETETEDGRETKFYLPPFYYSEVGTARRLREIMQINRENVIPEENAEKLIARLIGTQKKDGIIYDQTQTEAVKSAVCSKVFVLTGGPGTGKTTITKAIIEIFKSASKKVLLAAPTGRAAKRMSETCGLEAKTIHRLLESSPPEGFARNEENPLEGDVLILDECSMIDIILMYNLLKAVPAHMALVLVGDVDQLPSVGAGNVLSDIIESKTVPVCRLTKIFRQAAGSKIITNAHKINAGNMPDLTGGANSDFFFIQTYPESRGQDGHEEDGTNYSALTADEIVKLCKFRLPKYYKIDPINDIQVLTPMKRGETGADNLNRVLQSALNPNNLKLNRGPTEYRLNDKVMQIKNNYEKQIYNGDIGFICGINADDKTLSVNFDGQITEYDVLELDELVLSYAITIHKSQGGEFPVVVMPFSFSHYMMLGRNLLYTAVTRAKKTAVLLGDKKAVYRAVKNNTSNRRNTMLSLRLSGDMK